MAESTAIMRNRGSSLKDKFRLKWDKRPSQSLRLKSPKTGKIALHFSYSSPNLSATFSGANSYSIFTNGTFKVHSVVDDLCKSYDSKLIQYAEVIRAWETHQIFLNQDNITSENAAGVFNHPVNISSIVDIVGFDLKKDSVFYCLKLATTDLSLLFCTKYPQERDRLMYSLQWKLDLQKSTSILTSSSDPDILLGELQKLVKLTMESHLNSDSTHPILLRLVSSLLAQKYEIIEKIPHKAIITVLAPLVENNNPTPEMCDIFIKHCRQSPRSLIIVDIFTPMVQRILKKTVDFGKSTWLRVFVVEYIHALNSQNNGREAVQNFIHVMHGPLSQCPHNRVLSNLVAVCLSGIYNSSSTKQSTNGSVESKCLNNSDAKKLTHADCADLDDKSYTSLVQHNNLIENFLCNKNESVKISKSPCGKGNLYIAQESHSLKRLSFNSSDLDQCCNLSADRLADLALFVGILEDISRLPDWCAGLANFLQPLPFPDQAMTNIYFLRLMRPIIEIFAEDCREAVIRCLLYSRDDKEGWLHIYSPGRLACEDGGALFTKMMEALLRPGVQSGKLKKFLSMLARSHLGVIITLAVRENPSMIKVLRDMLQLGILLDEQEQLQAISAIRCTPTGRNAYAELKQLLSFIIQETGPKEFSLAPNSTDDDLKTLLSSDTCSCLRSLDLSLTRVTSKAVEVICRLTNLKSLNLWSTNFDDIGLKSLCDSLDLEYLNLCETQVTDQGIQCLEAMPNLRYLNLNSTSLQASTFLTLKRKLPKLIKYDIDYTEAMPVSCSPKPIQKSPNNAIKCTNVSANCFN